jgi:hypothetical protein
MYNSHFNEVLFLKLISLIECIFKLILTCLLDGNSM